MGAGAVRLPLKCGALACSSSHGSTGIARHGWSGRALGHRSEHIGQGVKGQASQIANVQTAKGDRKRLGLQPLAMADWAARPHHELGHLALHHRALAGGKCLHHIAACAGERAHVAGRLARLARAPNLVNRESRVHRHGGLLVGEKDPFARLARQIAPRHVDVVAQRCENVAQILALPGAWPGGNGPLAHGERIIRHHGRLCHVVKTAQSMAMRAGALRCVG